MSSHHHTSPVIILSISQDESDHAFLGNVFAHPRWVMIKAPDLAAARLALQDHSISVVLCDSDSTLESWTKIVDAVQEMQRPAPVIITSRLADDRLWSQALRLGAWDVLAKPFNTAEVVRTLRYAWEHSRNQHSARPTANTLSVAS